MRVLHREDGILVGSETVMAMDNDHKVADRTSTSVEPKDEVTILGIEDTPLGYRIFKRFTDIIFSLLVLVICSPVLLVIVIAIKLSSSGPVFSRQTRLGLHGRPFTAFKFRTMRVNEVRIASKDYVTDLIGGRFGPMGSGEVYKLENDPRRTTVGKFLRKTNLDELPEFFNVLRGDMTLVGPPPLIRYEVVRFSGWNERFSCKPGITGLSQITHRDLSLSNRVELDLEYVRKRSIWLDFKILLKTLFTTFHREPY